MIRTEQAEVRISSASDHAPTPAALRGKALVAWRCVWGLIALFDLSVLVLSMPGFFAQQATLCTDITLATCGVSQLHTGQLDALARLHLSLNGYAIYVTTFDALLTLAFLTIGALIFWHRSRERMGLFVSLLLITFGCVGIDDMHISAIANPPLLLEILGNIVLFIQWPAFGFFFYLFPDGRFVPRWAWLLGSLFIIQFVFYLLPYPYDILHWPDAAKLLVQLAVYGSAIGTQVYRYVAVATPLQRQQIKWFTFGFSASLLITMLFTLAPIFFPALNAPDSWFMTGGILGSPSLLFLAYFSIVASIGIALLRYRLWDIDVLINRTLVYGLLTGILLTFYIGLTIGGQALLVNLFGDRGDNQVLLVVSTLIVAALFQPLRRRIQTSIDRRFYRYKYDAARTLARFSTTLQSETDLAQLQERLTHVVSETMRPAHISLYLFQPAQTLRGSAPDLPDLPS